MIYVSLIKDSEVFYWFYINKISKYFVIFARNFVGACGRVLASCFQNSFLSPNGRVKFPIKLEVEFFTKVFVIC